MSVNSDVISLGQFQLNLGFNELGVFNNFCDCVNTCRCVFNNFDACKYGCV